MLSGNFTVRIHPMHMGGARKALYSFAFNVMNASARSRHIYCLRPDMLNAMPLSREAR